MAADLEGTVLRQRGLALYYQVAETLRMHMESGQLRPGDQLPREDELCAIFGVSRTTVRSALDLLERKGSIRRVQGRGTFVAEPFFTQQAPVLRSFTEEMLEKGLRPGARVVSVGPAPCGEWVAEKLHMRPGEEVIRVQRVRLADGDPIGIQTAYLPNSVCSALLNPNVDLSGSLYRHLTHECGIALHSARDTYYAGTVDEAEAELLQVPPRSSVFVVERLTLNSQGKPVECVRSLMRGDRYSISLELTRSSQQQ